MWHSSEILFAFFINHRAGLSPLAMGTILCAGLALSAGIALAVARMLRVGSFTLPRAQWLQLLGAIASSIAVMAFFAADLLPPAWRFGYLLGAAILFRIAYAIGDIPHNAMMALATANFDSRRDLATLRLFFSGLASITIAVILTVIVAHATLDRPGIFLTVAFFISVLMIAVSVRLARVRIAPAGHDHSATDPGRALARLRIAEPIVRQLALMCLLSCAISAFTILEPFYVASRYGDNVKQTILIASSMGLTLSQPVWARVFPRPTPRTITGAAIALLALSLTGFGFVEHAGRVGQPILSFVFGMANGGVGMAMWSSYAEEVARQRASQDPMAFALLTCFAKLGSACATILIAWSLSTGGEGVSPLAMTWAPVTLVSAALLIHLAHPWMTSWRVRT